MDALFEDAPIFVANTDYAKVKDRYAGERELLEGTFVPGGMTGRTGADDLEGADEKHFA